MMKGNLLIVDDEPEILFLLEFNLKKLADKIFSAANGEEALKVIASQEIHCILCDISMPIMNGVELIKRIREAHITVPFIFYTGHGTRALMLEVIKYGAFDFLNKPELLGLEKVVERGLNKGLGKDDITTESQGLESDFRKLLAKME